MATRGSRATATGLALTLIAVGAGVSYTGAFALLLCFVGVVAGSSIIAAGVRMADDPAPMGLFCTGGVLAAGVRRRNLLAFTGLLLTSSATMGMAVAGDAGPVLCLGMLALFLLGVTLINIGVGDA